MDKTIVLITGANTGLGFQIVRALCSSDNAFEILVGGRSLVKAQEASKAAVNEFPTTQSRTWPVQIDIENDEDTFFGELVGLLSAAAACVTEVLTTSDLDDELTEAFFDKLMAFSRSPCKTEKATKDSIPHLAKAKHQSLAILYNIVCNQHVYGTLVTRATPMGSTPHYALSLLMMPYGIVQRTFDFGCNFSY